ncbi:MAG: radical SAM protein [Syntrophaceae bacterium]|nr:radical SAM protein [Syntrophaceae bacterium]
MAGRIDLSKYCVVSIWFGCNNNCRICMLSRLRKTMPAVSYDEFKRVMVHLMRFVEYENLILSGGEVTTFEELEKYVEFAASLGCFNKIQIQTNGRRLSDRTYLERLVRCGINEFFVSVHGFEQTHDAATGVRGAFRQTLQGLQNLSNLKGINVISNTVLTRDNLPEITEFVSFLAKLSVSEIHMWNYFPMGSESKEDLIVSMAEICRLLPELHEIAQCSGKPLVMKSFPLCLPGLAPVYLDSVFPKTVLPDRFWKEFVKCGFGQCVHRQEGRCQSVECWGLSVPYIQKYGSEKDLLKPLSSLQCQEFGR